LYFSRVPIIIFFKKEVLSCTREVQGDCQVYTFGFRAPRERERTHSLAHTGGTTSLPTSLLAHKEAPKADTKQEQPKGYGLKGKKNPKPKKFFQAYYYNKVD
jgi:hypothetical protein